MGVKVTSTDDVPTPTLMKQLAIRLSWQTMLVKSLVIALACMREGAQA